MQNCIYTLKCKDISVCDVKIENSHIVDIIHTYNKEYAPVETFIFGYIDVNRLNQWLSDRAIPVDRDGYNEMIKQLNIKDNREYLVDNLALSLSDQYWLKPIHTDMLWKDINFFNRNYNVLEFSNVTFGKDNNMSSSIHIDTDRFRTPNASLGGVLKKIWIQKDKINYLLKGSHTIHNLEPINEVLSSKIAEILKVPCVQYTLSELKGKRTNQLISVCNDIVDEKEHLVSAYALILGYPERKIDNYASYIEFVMNELNVPCAKENIQKMLMIDFIMINEDRHLNNFALIRDSDTLKWNRVCPIYDTGKSMNTAINEEYWDFHDGEIRSFTGEFVSTDYLMDYIDILITSDVIKELKKLTNWYKTTLYQYIDILKLKETTIQALIKGYELRICIFEERMREKNLLRDC